MTTNNPTSPREELAACPFCGDGPSLYAGPTFYRTESDLYPGRTDYWVQCSKCGARGPCDRANHKEPQSEALARERWNTRHPVKAASPEGVEPVAWVVFATGGRCKGGQEVDSRREEVEQYGREIYGDGDFEVYPLRVIATTPPTSERAEVVAEPVGEAGSMPGTAGFTMAVFKVSDVPVGTKLYAAPPKPPKADQFAQNAKCSEAPAVEEITEEMVERARRYLRHGNLETAEAIEMSLQSIFDPPAALTTSTKGNAE